MKCPSPITKTLSETQIKLDAEIEKLDLRKESTFKWGTENKEGRGGEGSRLQ